MLKKKSIIKLCTCSLYLRRKKSAKQIVQQLFYTNTAVQTNCTMRERESKRYLNTFSIISNKKE